LGFLNYKFNENHDEKATCDDVPSEHDELWVGLYTIVNSQINLHMELLMRHNMELNISLRKNHVDLAPFHHSKE